MAKKPGLDERKRKMKRTQGALVSKMASIRKALTPSERRLFDKMMRSRS